MADRTRRLPQNITGEFFVDDSCIDCDACRQIAPAHFRDHGDQSSVYRQPETAAEISQALKALVSCPTASIGALTKHDMRQTVASFPSLIAENVYFCGFNSESSFGAWSYLIARPDEAGGNVLVDSPRFAAPLVRRIREFGCERVMSEADGAVRLGIERVIVGEEDTRLDDELLVIPTPGHTRGHQVLLYREKFLFTGDHLAWSPEKRTLTAFRSVNWYSRPEQTRSMEKLLRYRFEWVLPGHGRIHHDTSETMREHLRHCVKWMQATW